MPRPTAEMMVNLDYLGAEQIVETSSENEEVSFMSFTPAPDNASPELDHELSTPMVGSLLTCKHISLGQGGAPVRVTILLPRSEAQKGQRL